MASQGPPPSNFPASMGPGARPLNGDTPRRPTNWQAFHDARAQYTMENDAEGLRVGYELKGNHRNYSIPYQKMPIGGLSQWMLFGGEGRAKVTTFFVLDTIRGMENISGTRLSQSQVEGIALHSTKRMLYSYSSLAVVVAGGGYMTYRGWKDMKFPFLKPRPAERYTNFPNRYIPILRGEWARTMWQITRLNVWLALGLFIVSPIFNSMGSASMMAGLYRDDRTKDIVKVLRGPMNRIGSNTPQASPAKPNAPPEPSDGSEMDSSFAATGLNSTPSLDATTRSSPYGDQVGSEDAGSFGQQSPASMAPSHSSYSRRPPSESGRAGAEARSDFFFDDASPTAGNDPDLSPPGPYQSSGSGGTWERLRRGGATQGPSRTQTQMPRRGEAQNASSSPVNDESFSFSSGDEEKQLAKQQAQKEFDQMLERERRQGGSGSYGSGIDSTEKWQQESGGEGGGSAWEKRRRG